MGGRAVYAHVVITLYIVSFEDDESCASGGHNCSNNGGGGGQKPVKV